MSGSCPRWRSARHAIAGLSWFRSSNLFALDDEGGPPARRCCMPMPIASWRYRAASCRGELRDAAMSRVAEGAAGEENRAGFVPAFGERKVVGRLRRRAGFAGNAASSSCQTSSVAIPHSDRLLRPGCFSSLPKRGVGRVGCAVGSSCCWLWWASHARALIGAFPGRGRWVVAVTQVAIAARALSSIPVPVPRFRRHPTDPPDPPGNGFVRFVPPADAGPTATIAVRRQAIALYRGLPRQDGVADAPKVRSPGRQYPVRKNCADQRPDFPGALRDLLCQGEDIIRQVWAC